MQLISKTNFDLNLSLAWPLALNAVLVQSMVLVDLMLIAPLGEVAINALGIASAIIAFLIGIQFALGNGTQMLMARAFGRGDSERIAITLATGWLINLAFSTLSFGVLTLGSPSLLHAVANDPEVISEAGRYLSISAWMLLISSITQVMITYFNGSGRTRIPLYGFLIEVPFNLVISFILIYGYLGTPALGLQGAAAGSLVAVMVRLLYLALRLRREVELDLHSGLRSVNARSLKRQFAEIWPIAANHIALAGGMMLYQLLFAQLDLYAYAAIVLVMPWMRLGSQFTNAWSQATVINISQYRGRGESRLIPEFLRQTLQITLIMALLLCAAFLLFSLLIPMLYPAIEQQTLTALAVIAPIYILRPLVQAYNTFCGHTLRALGESFYVLRLHILVQWLTCLPLLALLIYLQAPLWLAFGVNLLEECLKTWWFRRRLTCKLA